MDIIPDSVAIGYVHPNIVTEGFARSLANACRWPANKILGLISASNPRQYLARNAVIEEFLEGPCEYLMWIDTDTAFEHNAIERLRQIVNIKQADMAAGLCFIYERGNNVVKPNFAYWKDDHFEFGDNYQAGEILTPDACGSAFVLIHRKVFEATGPVWHQNWVHHPATNGQPMGHDMSFFYDATITFGFKLVYDTGVKTGHIKHFELREQHFRDYQETL